MKKMLLALAIVAALLASGLLFNTFAAGDSSPGPARGKLLQRLAAKLNLTDDQKTQIKAIVKGERATLAPLVGRMHDARKNLRAAIHASDANESTVRAASAQVAQVEADLAVERMKLYGKIVPILTDAQRQQLAALQQRADDFSDNLAARIGLGLDD